MAKRDNVHLRKDGRYEARYVKGRDSTGRLIYGFCYARTYEEARDKADNARKKLHAGTCPGNHRPGCFAHYCDSWLATNHTRLKASSYAKYRTDMANHLKPYFGEKAPEEITSEMVDEFAQILLHDKKLSPKTVRDQLTLFHSVFSYIEKRTGQVLPAPEITYPKDPRKTVRVLEKEEESALLECLAREMDLCKFGVYIALRTGMRIGEICALKWSDISVRTATISISHTVQRIQRREPVANSKTALVVGSPKTDSSRRAIPLMPDIEALCEYFAPHPPDSYVLTGTGQCMDPRKLQRRLKGYLKECSIHEVHFHTLRHTFATRCVEVGFDIKTLSEILGHSNTSITMNKYVHPDLNLKRENMSRLKSGICL